MNCEIPKGAISRIARGRHCSTLLHQVELTEQSLQAEHFRSIRLCHCNHIQAHENEGLSEFLLLESAVEPAAFFGFCLKKPRVIYDHSLKQENCNLVHNGTHPVPNI
jgi:hypothetical protein